MSSLNIHRFGPAGAPQVLALHGVTGHGKRWEQVAERLPGVRVIAPDLRGHGRSTPLPPWDFETIVADLVELFTAEIAAPVVLVGHSFGGAVGLHLLQRYPESVRRLVLLDPAIGLDPVWLNEIALASLASPDYTDVAEARMDKQASGWGEVDPRVLDAELTEHLIPTANGRVGWRINNAAINAYWGQLAREFVLPPTELPTVLVQAMKVRPPFVTPEFRAALAARLGDNLTVHEWDCDHMVAQARPDEVAALIRAVL
ncbi:MULTISPECIES: alpha/beta fold hydrolase [unclassified Nocardia]|uniref:alpha/beta fold hydrolase n=1 Tax=unclassified Nocardia TaxID=2637762 RepID=UPI001CE413AA|nr:MULTISPECIES: alpha/beta hydrolase [unclassified Nocardia]